MCQFYGTPVKAVHEIGPNDKPLIGWKLLKYNEFSKDFQSPMQYTVWVDRKCRAQSIPGKTKNAAVGIYCFRSKAIAMRHAERNGFSQSKHQYRVVRLLLSGRIVEHEYPRGRTDAVKLYEGYRAQRAKIDRVYKIT